MRKSFLFIAMHCHIKGTSDRTCLLHAAQEGITLLECKAAEIKSEFCQGMCVLLMSFTGVYLEER